MGLGERQRRVRVLLLDYSIIRVYNIPLKRMLETSSSGFLKMQGNAWLLGKQRYLSPNDRWFDGASKASELERCPSVVKDGLIC